MQASPHQGVERPSRVTLRGSTGLAGLPAAAIAPGASLTTESGCCGRRVSRKGCSVLSRRRRRRVHLIMRARGASGKVQWVHAHRPAESITAANSAGGCCPEEGPGCGRRGEPPPRGRGSWDGAAPAAQFLEDGHLEGTKEAAGAGGGHAAPVQDDTFAVQVDIEGDPSGGFNAKERVRRDMHTHQPWLADRRVRVQREQCRRPLRGDRQVGGTAPAVGTIGSWRPSLHGSFAALGARGRSGQGQRSRGEQVEGPLE